MSTKDRNLTREDLSPSTPVENRNTLRPATIISVDKHLEIVEYRYCGKLYLKSMVAFVQNFVRRTNDKI